METQDTFEKLFKQYYAALYYYAYNLIEDAEESKDIVSDTFEYVWKNYERMQEDTIKSLLYVSVRNKCLDHLRHRNIHHQYVDLLSQATAEAVETEYREQDERLLRIRHVLHQLSPKTRHVFRECYFHKKKYQEVADTLNVSVSAIQKHVMKALQALRDEFSEKKT